MPTPLPAPDLTDLLAEAVAIDAFFAAHPVAAGCLADGRSDLATDIAGWDDQARADELANGFDRDNLTPAQARAVFQDANASVARWAA